MVCKNGEVAVERTRETPIDRSAYVRLSTFSAVATPSGEIAMTPDDWLPNREDDVTSSTEPSERTAIRRS